TSATTDDHSVRPRCDCRCGLDAGNRERTREIARRHRASDASVTDGDDAYLDGTDSQESTLLCGGKHGDDPDSGGWHACSPAILVETLSRWRGANAPGRSKWPASPNSRSSVRPKL